MKRWLFDFFSALSLALCVATCVAWVRSYWTADGFQGAAVRTYVVATHDMGRVMMCYAIGFPAQIPLVHQSQDAGTQRVSQAGPYYGAKPVIWSIENRDEVAVNKDGGIALITEDSRLDEDQAERYPLRVVVRFHDIQFHDGWLAAAFSILPILWAVRRWRYRYAPGFCQRCGYDLRATRRRCPECGAVPDGATA